MSVEQLKFSDIYDVEGSLRESKLLVDKNDLLVLLDSRGKLLYTSIGLCNELGFTSSELLQKRIWDLVHTQDMYCLARPFKEMIQYKVQITATFRWENKNGGWQSFYSEGTPIETGYVLVLNKCIPVSEDILFELVDQEIFKKLISQRN